MEIQIIRVKELELPVPVDKKPDEHPRIRELQEKYLSGKEVSKEEVALLVGTSLRSAGNGNCNAC